MDDFDETTQQPVVAATPANLIEIKRTLRLFEQEHVSVVKDLMALHVGAAVDPASRAYEVIAAVATNSRYPVEDPTIEPFASRLVSARNGSLRKYVDEAIHELKSVSRIVERSLEALALLDEFNVPLPGLWSNMPATMLARDINAYSRVVFGNGLVSR